MMVAGVSVAPAGTVIGTSMNPRTLMTAWPIPLLSPGLTRSAVGPVTVIVSVEARLGWMAVWFDRSLNEPATKLTVTVPGTKPPVELRS